MNKDKLNNALNNKHLIIILITSILIIVALVVSIIIVKLQNSPLFERDPFANSTCSQFAYSEDTEELINCLEKEFRDGDMEQTVKLYSAAINQAFEKGDERKFYELSSSLAYSYLYFKKCEDALSVLGDSRIDQLSTETKLDFYGDMIDSALGCNDSKKVEQYRALVDDIWNSEEIEPFVEDEEVENNNREVK